MSDLEGMLVYHVSCFRQRNLRLGSGEGMLEEQYDEAFREYHEIKETHEQALNIYKQAIKLFANKLIEQMEEARKGSTKAKIAIRERNKKEIPPYEPSLLERYTIWKNAYSNYYEF